jgi:uncharacterized protein (DUF302 family)
MMKSSAYRTRLTLGRQILPSFHFALGKCFDSSFSSPSKVMFASVGEMMPPCGVPAFYVSRKSLREVLEILDAGVGHTNMNELWQKLFHASTVSEVDEIMLSAVGSSGLIEFLRFNHGGIVHKDGSKSVPGNVRLVVGNPSIMRRMVEHVPDAGSYAPVTILIDERPDATHISYDRMVSFLQSYSHEEALKVARDLDAKVEKLLATAAK